MPAFAIALYGSGAHPASWRWPTSELPLSAQYWTKYVQAIDNSIFSFVSFLQYSPDYGYASVGEYLHLDPCLIAAYVAPLTQTIGLIPQIDILHTEPFHTAKSTATLDYISHGRAGIEITALSDTIVEHNYGRRPELLTTTSADITAEVSDYTNVLRALWDSWEDTAEIRDKSSGKFIDRNKLHYINFSGKFFSIKGPLITPRPPQGQPLIVSSLPAADPDIYIEQASGAHPVCDNNSASDPIDNNHDHKTFLDLEVYCDTPNISGKERKNLLDSYQLPPDMLREIFIGSVPELVALVSSYLAKGYAGIRFFPGVISEDLPILTQNFASALTDNSISSINQPAQSLMSDNDRDNYANYTSVPAHRLSPFTQSLRYRLGFTHPVNRYEQDYRQ